MMSTGFISSIADVPQCKLLAKILKGDSYSDGDEDVSGVDGDGVI